MRVLASSLLTLAVITLPQLVHAVDVECLVTGERLEDYFRDPTYEKGMAVLAVIPENDEALCLRSGELSRRGLSPKDELLEKFDANMDVMARRLRMGDRVALKIALRWIRWADGVYLEHLRAAIGGSMTVQPQAFLEGMMSSGRVDDWGRVATSVSEELQSDNRLECLEIRSRRDAISSVEGQGIAVVREAVLGAIEAYLVQNCP